MSEKEGKMKSTKTKKKDTAKTGLSRLPSSDLDAGTENHIVPLEPTQTYIFRDFLQTNDILNTSMTMLKEQNSYLVEKVGKAQEKDRGMMLREATYEVRQNAHALAQIVQAKVAYIKAVKQ